MNLANPPLVEQPVNLNGIQLGYPAITRKSHDATSTPIGLLKDEVLINLEERSRIMTVVKDDKISLSPGRVKSFQKEIEKRTIKRQGKTQKSVIQSVHHYLYKGDGHCNVSQFSSLGSLSQFDATFRPLPRRIA